MNEVEACLTQIDELRDKLKKQLDEAPAVGQLESQALRFAVAAGLPPQMTYTVRETAKYLGINYQALRSEHQAGRLRYVLPNGSSRGGRIAVAEVDRWIKENQR